VEDENGYMGVDKQLELAEDENHYLNPILKLETSVVFEEDNYAEVNDGNETKYINCNNLVILGQEKFRSINI